MSETQDIKKKIEEGPPLFMESLMSAQEFRENKRRYPKTQHLEVVRPLSAFKEGEFKCRYRMGAPLLSEEIASVNYNLDYLRKKAGI